MRETYTADTISVACGNKELREWKTGLGWRMTLHLVARRYVGGNIFLESTLFVSGPALRDLLKQLVFGLCYGANHGGEGD